MHLVPARRKGCAVVPTGGTNASLPKWIEVPAPDLPANELRSLRRAPETPEAAARCGWRPRSLCPVGAPAELSPVRYVAVSK